MIEKLFEWLENSWSFQDIWERGTNLDYVISKNRISENLKKAIKEGNVDGFFLWVETEFQLEDIWNKGMDTFNKDQNDVTYNMTYYQFKVMFRNKIKETTIMEEPELAQNLFGGSADEFKST